MILPNRWQNAEERIANRPFTWASNACTDVGRMRDLNEDAYLERADVGLWVVADGMGGYSAGDVASGLLTSMLGLLEPSEQLGTFVGQITARAEQVNQKLLQEAEARDKSVIGTTLAALVFGEQYGVYIWAGDSRVYLYRAGELHGLTRDHSTVEEMVDRGELSREDVESHPAANEITRAVGGEEDLELDAEIIELNDGDIFVLCSDGLTKEVADAEIAEVISRHEFVDLARELVDISLARDGRDNITVVAVRADRTKPLA